jgi:hypothetical protein
MSNPQTGRRKKVKKSISFGTIIFWGFIGWMWFGDTISEVFDDITKTAAVVTVNGEKKVIDVDKLIDNAVKKAEEAIESVKKDDPEPPPNPDEGKEMIAEQKSNDKFPTHENLYGGSQDKY